MKAEFYCHCATIVFIGFEGSSVSERRVLCGGAVFGPSLSPQAPARQLGYDPRTGPAAAPGGASSVGSIEFNGRLGRLGMRLGRQWQLEPGRRGSLRGDEPRARLAAPSSWGAGPPRRALTGSLS